MSKVLPGRVAGVLGACLLSAVLLRLSYPVPGWYPLAWVALVPWFIVLRAESGRAAISGSVAMGFCAAALGLSWQYIVTVLGGALLSVYVGLYFILFAWLVGVARGRLRVPFVLAAPAVWVGCEYLRSFLFTGFPWLFVGHTQHPFTAIIQVSDLFGAYAVSFLVVATNAFLAEFVLAWWRKPLAWKRIIPGAALVVILFGAALGYGIWRLAGLLSREGPRVGIVQGNIPQEIKNVQKLETIRDIFEQHCRLNERLVGSDPGRQFDLVVWPETMIQLPLNRLELPVIQEFRDRLTRLAQGLRCPLLVGAHTEIGRDGEVQAQADGVVGRVTDDEIAVGEHVYLLPHFTDPATGEEPIRRILVREGQEVHQGDNLARYESIVHNSAYLIRPDGLINPADRYDKNHLVPFGEYVPMRWMRSFLGTVIPFPKGFTPSARLNLIRVGEARFGVLICFEDVFPYLVRRYVVRSDGQGADFLINISNDGWFEGSHELDQHLAMCAFRAVEFRIGIVRSVNSGISGIINPDGRIPTLVRDRSGRCKLIEGVAVGRVRLREGLTFYARHGDILGKACLAVAVVAFLAAITPAILRRFRRRKGEG